MSFDSFINFIDPSDLPVRSLRMTGLLSMIHKRTTTCLSSSVNCLWCICLCCHVVAAQHLSSFSELLTLQEHSSRKADRASQLLSDVHSVMPQYLLLIKKYCWTVVNCCHKILSSTCSSQT